MIKYAANDVIYLPKIYYVMTELIKNLNIITLTDVLETCNVYLNYPNLNKGLTQKSRDLILNTEVQGLIK